MKMKQTGKVGRKLLSLALALALMVGFAPGMDLTARADDSYTSLKNTTTVITFDNKQWYLIDYDDSTVTLLSKECVGASVFNPNEPDVNTYSGSTVESFVNNWYRDYISEDAKAAVDGNGMFLLTKDQATALSSDVLKCPQASGAYSNHWWLCSPGTVTNSSAERVKGNTGNVDNTAGNVWIAYGVRPALRLDLSKVTFSNNTFALPVASVTSGGTTTEYTTFSAALDAWTNNSTLTLLSDVTTSSTISVSGTKTLDLNGYGIKATGTGYSVITVGSGANLTLNDSRPTETTHYFTVEDPAPNGAGLATNISTTGGNGRISFTGGYITGGNSTNTGGGGVQINGGTLNIYGGTIIGNTANTGGGVRAYSGGTVRMNGGSVRNNYATNRGGGVEISASDIEFNGGTVSYNRAGEGGGGIGVYDNNATICVTGGRVEYNISGTHAAKLGGGIDAGESNKNITFTMSGNPVVKNNLCSVDNSVNNCVARRGTTIQIVGEMTGNAGDIGISLLQNDPRVFTSGNTTYIDPTKFVSDNSSYVVVKNSSNQLELVPMVTVTFDANDGSAVAQQKVAPGTVVTKPDDPTKEGYTFGGWYTEADCATAFDFTAAVTADTTLYAKWTLNTYAVTFDANGGAGAMEEQTVSHNAAAVLTANTFTRAGCNFAGWNTGADGTGTPYADGASVTLTAPLTLYAQWTTKPVYTASGTVKQESDNAPISGATVRLVQGERKLAVTATNDDGAFSFSAPDGIYNIVAEHGGKTRTELVTLRADQQVHIVMPSASVNSVLMVTGDDTPNVMVGGLDELAEQIGAQGASVTVTMTVEKKDENAAVGAEYIKYEADGMSLDYLDISLTETVSSTESPPTPTDRVLEIVVPYDFSKKKQTTVAVYRYHDDSAAPLAESNTRADGTYRLDKDNNLVYIYANRFSTYAIGFTPTYAVSGTLNFGSFTGAVSFSLAGNSIQKTASSTVTNGEGSYSFTGVPAGTYDMTASWNEDGKAQTLTFTVMVPAGTP